jgi:5-methylcytosine-specific restriction endonuclease McrA
MGKANYCSCGCGVTPSNYRNKCFERWSKGYPFQNSGLYYCANHGNLDKNGDICTYVSVKCPKAHVDHVIPKAEGGMNCINNLRIMCEHCNTSKGDDISNREVYLYNLGDDNMRVFHKRKIVKYQNNKKK